MDPSGVNSLDIKEFLSIGNQACARPGQTRAGSASTGPQRERTIEALSPLQAGHDHHLANRCTLRKITADTMRSRAICQGDAPAGFVMLDDERLLSPPPVQPEVGW